MKLNKKMTMAVSDLVIVILIVSTLIVAYTVKKQNMTVSVDALKNSFTINQYQHW